MTPPNENRTTPTPEAEQPPRGRRWGSFPRWVWVCGLVVGAALGVAAWLAYGTPDGPAGPTPSTTPEGETVTTRPDDETTTTLPARPGTIVYLGDGAVGVETGQVERDDIRLECRNTTSETVDCEHGVATTLAVWEPEAEIDTRYACPIAVGALLDGNAKVVTFEDPEPDPQSAQWQIWADGEQVGWLGAAQVDGKQWRCPFAIPDTRTAEKLGVIAVEDPRKPAIGQVTETDGWAVVDGDDVDADDIGVVCELAEAQVFANGSSIVGGREGDCGADNVARVWLTYEGGPPEHSGEGCAAITAARLGDSWQVRRPVEGEGLWLIFAEGEDEPAGVIVESAGSVDVGVWRYRCSIEFDDPADYAAAGLPAIGTPTQKEAVLPELPEGLVYVDGADSLRIEAVGLDESHEYRTVCADVSSREDPACRPGETRVLEIVGDHEYGDWQAICAMAVAEMADETWRVLTNAADLDTGIVVWELHHQDEGAVGEINTRVYADRAHCWPSRWDGQAVTVDDLAK